MPIILATWKLEIGRVMFQGQPGQKFPEIPSHSITGHIGGTPVTRTTRETEFGRIYVPDYRGGKNLQDPISTEIAGWWHVPLLLDIAGSLK